MQLADSFILFDAETQAAERPKKFTFPFYYTPHPLAIKAAKALQSYIVEQKEWKHNFGNIEQAVPGGIGKMFGVLVCEDQSGRLGYLQAFSGKLANSNHHRLFVPPVYDVLVEDAFYKQEERILNQLNRDIEVLESDEDYLEQCANREQAKADYERALLKLQSKNKALKKIRKAKRQELSKEDVNYPKLLDNLAKESVYRHYLLRDLKAQWQKKLQNIDLEISNWNEKIETLKEERRSRSSAVQKKIFEQYKFLNIHGEQKDLQEIFKNTFFQKPPAGSGECAAPKLLQYAFLHQLKPVAMAEFWWGQTLKSEIRKQGQYYPACKGKCEPILSHMLQGMDVEDNPLLINPAAEKNIEIIYEDEAIVVINKPPEFLSVPGKTIQDSVLTRLREMYPNCSGPLLLHRLDMSTSGILLMAKTEKHHKFLQQQFIKRLVKKTYIAVLDGKIREQDGRIDLPLRGNLYDRPKQMVCPDHGKAAVTRWEIIERKADSTRVYFYPETGRTHQLRVHAAHHQGLNAPIKGDDLYGTRADRLHLHAFKIEFVHPKTKQTVQFEAAVDF